MKKIYTYVCAVVLTVLVSGCTGTDDGTLGTGNTNDNQNVYNNPQNQTQIQQSAIPPQSQGMGYAYDLSGYLLPVKTLNNKSVYKTFNIVTEDSNGYFTQGKSIVKRYLEASKDELNEPLVNIFEGISPNLHLVEKYVVSPSRISVYSYDGDNNLVSQEQYPRSLQVGGDLLRNENGACVLKEHLTGYEMDNIPVQADPNGHYGSVLHFYCGTSDGARIDRYYADGWGQILAIRQNRDGTTQYSVFDQNSYEEAN